MPNKHYQLSNLHYSKKSTPAHLYRGVSGSPNWARTSDIMINSHALYRLSYGGIYKSWHLPIFPGRHHPSIFGTIELNFCVRNGNRCTLNVINTNFCFCLSTFDIIALYFLNCKRFLKKIQKFFYISVIY